MEIITKLTNEFNLKNNYAQNIISLLDEGSTIPFIARYRKEMTGNLDDQILREFSDRLTYIRNLEKRKEEVTKTITELGKMTPEIEAALDAAETLTEVEDIYRPFKQKKKTRATVAIAKGLEPFALLILEQDPKKTGKIEDYAKEYISEEKGVANEKEAIDGARDIIAEIVSDNAELRKKLRNVFQRNGTVVVKRSKKEGDGAKVYEMYTDYSEGVENMKAHRILAMNRGEDEEFLKVKIEVDENLANKVVSAMFVKEGSIFTSAVQEACVDSYGRLIEPSIEREIRAMLTERAQEQAIKMFDVNLRPLLMQPPVKGKVMLGFDPGYRTGCKLAVVDETGRVLDKLVVYPTIESEAKKEEAKVKLKAVINKHKVDIIVIGNGTASKESEIFVAELIKELDRKVTYAVVSEAGASVYSASKLGAEEFPDYDVSERSAVSIARRLQDPLAELIKIDPKSIGVGQYQHDMPPARLDQVLSGVLEDCVNSVGVDVNTASASLLTYVSGLNSGIAKSLVAYREQKGGFKERNEFMNVPKLKEKAFEQCAGFLRIPGGKNILDNTAVHPESYEQALKLLSLFNFTENDIKDKRISNLRELVKEYGEEKAAKTCKIGVSTMNDIITELVKPGRDIRESVEGIELRSDIMDIKDIAVGMELKGTVRNVTDFGAFIDLGVHQDGLAHISEISDRYIKHPSEVLKVGQIVKVRVINVDLSKNRIGLSLRSERKESFAQNTNSFSGNAAPPRREFKERNQHNSYNSNSSQTSLGDILRAQNEKK